MVKNKAARMSEFDADERARPIPTLNRGFLSPIRVAAFDYLRFQARHPLPGPVGPYCFLPDKP
jgi:hypothetical protein